MSRLLLLSLTFVLVACGQKGALYLPAKPAPVAAPETSAAVGVTPVGAGSAEQGPAPKENDEKDDKDQPATVPQP